MNPIGGSEILYNNLIKYTGQDWKTSVNLISSFTDPKFVDNSKINVVWQHLYTDQGAVQGMSFSEFTNKIKYWIYVSNWQLDSFKEKFQIDNLNNRVIKNAIDPIEFKEKPSNKIRLIYTSMPDRGLEILLNALKIINRKDIELIVYSSTIIYGKGYSESRRGLYDHLFNQCKTTPNILYKGYGMNQAVRKALQTAHILAYPSIYPETSCLAAIEAGAAGCKIVTTDYGALVETCNGWAKHVPYTKNYNELTENYAYELNKTIEDYWNQSSNIVDQSKWFNDYYSWQNRKLEWQQFFNSIINLK